MNKRLAETWLTHIWYERTKPPFWLQALSQLHSVFRSFGLLGQLPQKAQTLQVPTIVVGNITAGGSGKTPVVISLAKALMDEDWRVGVVMRGYHHSRAEKQPRRVLSDTDPKVCGDEALLISQSTGAPVWVGKNRSACVQEAIASGVEVVLCDDGLQHGKLERSYEICLIDGSRGFGNGQLMPAGPLRDPVDRLDTVDQILIKGEGFGVSQAYSRFELLPQSFFHPLTQTHHDVGQWPHQEVVALCGIANPASFKGTLEHLGLRPSLMRFRDHHEYGEADFVGLEDGATVVVTEKDWVKIERLGLDESQLKNIYVLKVRAEIETDALNQVLSHVRSYQVNA